MENIGVQRAGTSVGTSAARRLARFFGRVLLKTLIRTTVFLLILLDFHAGYMTHGLVLNIPPTAPAVSSPHHP